MDDEAAAVLVENRKLRSENRHLREEIAAVRSSRWWGLHPRLLLKRLRRSADPSAPTVPSARTERALPLSSVRDQFAREVVPRLELSRDTFTDRIPELDPVLTKVRTPDTRILEIGSYEGLSACFFLWRLATAEVTCVDTFEGGLDDAGAARHVSLQATFDRNLARLDAARVTKFVDDSRATLLRLQREARRFDLIYVDGSHLGLDVLVDAALAWRLLEPNGVLVFDDYRWNHAGDDALLRPGPAIDAILQLLEGKYEMLLRSAQVAIRKLPQDVSFPRAGQSPRGG